MKKEILLEKAFMQSNPYLSCYFSFVEVNRVTAPWLVKFFTSPSVYIKEQSNEFHMCSHSIVSSLYLNDYFLMCCPFVEVCNINQKLLPLNIIDIIENAVKNGYCMTAVINPQYIKAYGNIELNEHDLLISGFDNEKKILLGNDFFPPRYKFGQYAIPYQEYSNAFVERDEKYNIRFLKKKNVVSIPDNNDIIETLLEALTNMLNERLRVENPYYALAYQVKKEGTGEFVEKKRTWTGIGIYDGMLCNIDKIPSKYWIMLIDTHRLIRYSLSLVLPDNKYTIGLEEIETELKIIMNLGIKYLISQKKEVLENMSERLVKLKRQECICLNHILEQLKQAISAK